MAVEFWTRRQPVTSYPSKGKGRNNPFSFENFKTFVGGLSHTVAFAFGTREQSSNLAPIVTSLGKVGGGGYSSGTLDAQRENNKLTSETNRILRDMSERMKPGGAAPVTAFG
jgi:hypothetical protein